jgi:hypothetical protein
MTGSLFRAVCLTVAALSVHPRAVAQPAGLLERVRTQMASNLARLPDYTCLQTIQRMERRIPARRFELMDTVRLEVALIGGNELFSWPGATAFDDNDVLQIVPVGLIGKGNFAFARPA